MPEPTKLRKAKESICGAGDVAEVVLDMRWSRSRGSAISGVRRFVFQANVPATKPAGNYMVHTVETPDRLKCHRRSRVSCGSDKPSDSS
jgi:hypothetical protein